jgi:peptidyl-prolyl cis-trans isomerase D
MGIMGFLRNRMGVILVVFIAFALLAFIAMDVVHYGSSFIHGDNNDLGEVAGQKIAVDSFNMKVDENTNNFIQQSHQTDITPQIKSYIQETTWEQEVNKRILGKEMDQLGLVVGIDEIHSLIQGDNLSPQIAQAFGDPQTGQVDRAKLNQYLAYITSPQADTVKVKAWNAFIEQVIENKRQEKYMVLVSNGLYVNSLDANDDYEGKNKLVNFKYVKLDYASVPESKVTLTDDDYQSYYNDHKNEFKIPEELRTFQFVSFNAAPSKADSAVIKTQADKLAADFKNSTDDSLFVVTNAETKTPIVYQRKGQLEPQLDSVMFKADKGFIYGPYIANGSYKIAKLVDERMSPDSVQARHILLPVAEGGGTQKAMATADSLKKVIASGKASFSDMAKQYSADKGSADKGGELGTFGRGSMVPSFEDAVFNGKKGDLVIVTSQYGVHLIEIENQKGSSKVVKVAIVDKPLTASNATESAAYSKAQAFLADLKSDNFNAEAKAAGVKPQVAQDVSPQAASFTGVMDGREVVRWAYKANINDISDQVFTIGNQYIVAQVTQIKPQGILPLDIVKAQIKPQVLNAAKGKLLADKLQAAENGTSDINQVAQKAGGTVSSLQNIVFANPVIPASGPEYKLIGAIFDSQPGKLSKPIQAQTAAYVFVVDSFMKPAPLANAVREKEQLTQALLQRTQQQVPDALKDKANVKDYRVKFL